MGFDYKMKNPENGGILRGFETIRAFLLAIWKEQNCSSGGKNREKNDLKGLRENMCSEIRLTAVHEAGHAFLCTVFGIPIEYSEIIIARKGDLCVLMDILQTCHTRL
jgi:hypothetical protein